MSMIQVALFPSGREEEAGRVAFHTLLVNKESDYECSPQGILTLEEVKQICIKLRHLPQIHSGTVGRFLWRELNGE